MDLRFVRLGPFWLESYGIAVSVACAVAWWLYRRQLSRADLPPGWASLALWVGVPVGVASAWWVATLPGLVSGTSTVLGGWIGGVGAFALVARLAGASVRRLLDALAPCLCMAQAIGRLGCFCAGHCYGVTTNAPWGVTYPRGAPPVVDAVHPVQLYAALASALIGWLGLRWHTQAPGRRAAWVALAMLVQRALCDLLRPEPQHAGLTLGQWLALSAVAAAALAGVRRYAGPARSVSASRAKQARG